MREGRYSEAYDPAYAARGILSEYGASAPEEDWATIAAAVVQEDPKFWALARRFPRLLAKGRLAARFYRRTFPGMRLREAGAPASGVGFLPPGEGRVGVGRRGLRTGSEAARAEISLLPRPLTPNPSPPEGRGET